MNEVISEQKVKKKINKLNTSLSQDIKILESMIAKTEDFYGLIADRLPEIERNIDETIEETQLLINYFIETEEFETQIDGGFKMAEALGDLQERIAQVYDFLSVRDEISESLEGFVRGDNDDRAQFTRVLNLIEELEEELIELEDLSINAIIVSARAGKEGAGFRVISNEINQLATEIKEKYEFIEESILTLQDWYRDFTDSLTELVETEEKVASKYKVEIKEIFDEILASLQIIANMLKDFMENIQAAVEPIYEIMVLAQNQDIIRQNIENLIEILKSTKQEIRKLEVNEMENTEILDTLVFITEAANLSQRLMDSILNQLDDSLFAIRDEFEKINTDLVEVQEDGEELTAFFAGTKDEESESGISLELIYQDLINFIPELTEQLAELENKYQNLLSNKGVFYTNMKEIQKRFTETNSIANQFNKIKLLAKIEFTRMSEAKKSFGEDIELAIENFISSSEKNYNLYGDLKEDLEANYSEFMEIAIETRDMMNQSSQVIGESKEKLLLTKKLIKEAIQALQQSIEELISEVSVVEQELEECYTLQQKGEEIINSLAEFNDESLRLKESYLSKMGRDNWEEHNERLQELMDKFTSYLERKTAQEEMTDLEIDVGSEGGDLTLF